jgi:hypothetical protein
MKILKSGIEMTPKELSATKAGNDCACACQTGFNTADIFQLGSGDHMCECGCMRGTFNGSSRSARTYPY